MFLRNRWYVAAWSHDVGTVPLARVMLGEPIVLYRTRDGAVIALEDRCPHRNLPLSAGRRIDDTIECGYHGLVFDHTGRCTHVPGQTEVPRWAAVRSYPVAERNRWVFVWFGDPAQADPALLPDHHVHLTDPSWRAVIGQSRPQCGYRLILDNLLDLSHLTYVHGSTTGNRALAEQATIDTEVEGDRVRVTRWMEDIPPAPAFQDYGGYDSNIDRWQVSLYMPPSYIYIVNGSDVAGRGLPAPDRYDRHGKWGFKVYHMLTPETAVTTHQFWAVAAHVDWVPPAKFDTFAQQMRDVIVEDLLIYEAQQRAIDLDAGAIDRDANPRGAIPADKGLLEMRRIIRRLHAREQADPAVAAQ